MIATVHPHRRAARAACLALILPLAACGGGADPTGSAGSSAAPSAGASAGTSGPIRITDDFGEVELPAPPERIVTLVDYGADMLAAFDRMPVAAQIGSAGSRPEYLGKEYVDLPSVGTYAEPSLEAIASQEPDLIVGLTAAHGELRDQLSRIAPTIVVEPRSYQDVLDHIDLFGTVLAEPDTAEEIARGLQEDIDEARQASTDTSCLLTNSNGQGVSLMPINTVAPSVLAEICDYAYPEEASANSVESSVEALVDLDPAHMFVAAIVPEGASAVDALARDPLWGQLQAVQDGTVVEVDPTIWLFGRGPTAIERVISEASTHLSGAGS